MKQRNILSNVKITVFVCGHILIYIHLQTLLKDLKYGKERIDVDGGSFLVSFWKGPDTDH